MVEISDKNCSVLSAEHTQTWTSATDLLERGIKMFIKRKHENKSLTCLDFFRLSKLSPRRPNLNKNIDGLVIAEANVTNRWLSFCFNYWKGRSASETLPQASIANHYSRDRQLASNICVDFFFSAKVTKMSFCVGNQICTKIKSE